MRGIVLFAALAAELVVSYAHPAMFQHHKRDIEEPPISISRSVPPLGTGTAIPHHRRADIKESGNQAGTNGAASHSPPPPKISIVIPPFWPPGNPKSRIPPTIPVPTPPHPSLPHPIPPHTSPHPSPHPSPPHPSPPHPSLDIHPDRRSDEAEDGLGSIISGILPLPTLSLPPLPKFSLPPLPTLSIHPDRRSDEAEEGLGSIISGILPLPTLSIPPLPKLSLPPLPTLSIPLDNRNENNDKVFPTPPPNTPSGEHLDRRSDQEGENLSSILPLPSLSISLDERNNQEKKRTVPTTLPDALSLAVGVGGGLI